MSFYDNKITKYMWYGNVDGFDNVDKQHDHNVAVSADPLVLSVADLLNDLLYKVAFLFTNGIVGVSIWLFRNSLVIHKLDYLVSLFIHLGPLICMYTFRWFTLP